MMQQVTQNTMNNAQSSILSPMKKAATSSTTGSGSTTSGTGTTTGSTDTDIGSTFLSLLVQELQNQDPTNPVDSTAMVGQMISLNQLDQLISINQAVGGSTGSTSTTTTTTGSTGGTGVQGTGVQGTGMQGTGLQGTGLQGMSGQGTAQPASVAGMQSGSPSLVLPTDGGPGSTQAKLPS